MIKHIELTNDKGMIIRGYLDMPINFNGEILLMFHGFTGNKMEHARHFINFSRLISKKGFASLRFDFSGNGESDGDFPDFTFETMMKEAKMIVEYAKSIENVTKVNLLGFSMGGAVVSALSAIYKNEINKIILWSAASNISELIRKAYESEEKLENGNSIHGTFEISKTMYETAKWFDPLKGITNYTNPALIINGKEDKIVNYLLAIRYGVLYYNSRVHLINTAGHGYDAINERDDLYNTTIDFLVHNEVINRN